MRRPILGNYDTSVTESAVEEAVDFVPAPKQKAAGGDTVRLESSPSAPGVTEIKAETESPINPASPATSELPGEPIDLPQVGAEAVAADPHVVEKLPPDELPLDVPRRVVESPKSSRRKPVDDKASSLGLPARGTSPAQQIVNQRRRRNTWTLVAILAASNVLIVGGSCAWLYNQVAADMETRLSDAVTRVANIPAPAPAPVTPVTPPPSEPTPTEAAAKAVPMNSDEWRKPMEELQGQMSAEIAAAKTRATELQAGLSAADTRAAKLQSDLEAEAKKSKELADAADEKIKAADGRLKSAEERLQAAEEQNKVLIARLRDLAAASQTGDQPKAVAVLAETVPGGQAVAENLSPTQSELVLLKERNRLTSLADEAIATASREPYEELWKAVDDPRMVKLVHAARAEILRVQQFYLAGSRLQKYDIPVAEVFPETPNLRDAQLSDDQLVSLLGNAKQAWQNRVKAAWLLGQRKSPKVAEALVKAVKEDPNLDVVKECTFSFEQMTGYRATLFEPKKLEAWWKEFTTLPTIKEPARSPNSPKKNAGNDKPQPTADAPKGTGTGKP